jgi:hypothetical protein
VKEEINMDLIFLGLLIGSFIVFSLYINVCDSLKISEGGRGK